MTPTTPDRLLGPAEHRAIDDYEVRSEGNEFVVLGYASLFESEYQVNGGPDVGGWNERVHRNAFDKTLSSSPDVHFLINHAGKSLARTKSGTLKLSADKKGLLSEARIDRRTQDGRDLEISMERGDLDEMSFGFRTVRHDWPGELRTLLEVNLDKGDVSVVNNGANGATRIRLAHPKDVLEALAHADLTEVRSMDNPAQALREARAHLDRLLAEITPPSSRTLSIAEALRVHEGLTTL